MTRRSWIDVRQGAYLRLAAALWIFAYLLEGVMNVLEDGLTFPEAVLMSAPLCAVAIGLSLLLNRVRIRTAEQAAAVRWALILVLVIIVAAFHTGLDLLYQRLLALAFFPEWQGWALDATPRRVFILGILYLWSFGLATTLSWAAGVNEKALESARRTAELEAETYKAEAAILRLQLNPHFLVNTMASVATMVKVGRADDAEEMIIALCGFLQASITQDPSADVPLWEEIDVVEDYLRLEWVRFRDRMTLDIHVADAVKDARVPHFLLQPLAENAVKHGLARGDEPMHLSIDCDRKGDNLIIEMENRMSSAAPGSSGDGDASSIIAQRGGLGLANIKRRLALAFGDRAMLQFEELTNGFRAVITMPFDPA